jgi:hypothetical protein
MNWWNLINSHCGRAGLKGGFANRVCRARDIKCRRGNWFILSTEEF